jgi:exopolyphosphatase / guanosine-5'-triphosphate,3'-diphosphate pyrophosphatase
VADRLKNPVREAYSSSADISDPKGRLRLAEPVAVVDIGSNSVRLVAYEGLTRAPTPIFNEKVLCGLGRGVASTGLLPEDGVREALHALARFRTLLTLMGITDVRVLATAAARDAKNGPAFIAEAEKAIGQNVELISGKREANLSALGVLSGMHHPDGIVGDLGGGSLELIDIDDRTIGKGVSLQLGGLALMDASNGSLKKAEKIVTKAIEKIKLSGKKRTFYAVGGTWRALAKLHMRQVGYPLNVLHGYRISAQEAIDFCRMTQRLDPDTMNSISEVSTPRRPLLAYGALVLEHILLESGCSDVVFSALGVREGLLYELLSEKDRKLDPLLSASSELNLLRSRSPLHGEELISWTDALFASSGLEETSADMRLRAAACLVADIGWRAHPDYRGEQSLNIISNAAFVGIDHPGRAYIALSIYYRHEGISDQQLSPRVRELTSTRLLERARLLGAAMRVAYNLSASMPSVLPRIPLVCRGSDVILTLPPELAPLSSDRLVNRMRQLARLLGKNPVILTEI